MTQFQYSPARNVCSDKVCNSFVASADSALACTEYGDFTQGGWPAAGGRITITFWGAPCPPSEIPSLSMCFLAPLQLAWCSPPPNKGENYDPTKFITNYGYFATPTSVQGTVAQLRWSAVLQGASQTSLTVTVTVEVLGEVAGQNVWNDWYSNTFTLPIVGTYERNAGNAFVSNPQYIPVNVQNPSCDVKFISVVAGIEPLRFGCGVGQNDYTCGLYDGTDYITCARGLVEDKTGVQLPVPILFGLNSSTCGAVGVGYCNCDDCAVTTSFPLFECYFNADPTFKDYVKTNFNETVGYQQGIQIATGAPFPIMLKLVDGVRYVYFCPTSNLANWERQAFNVVQANKPTIVVVENSDWKITIYFTRFPSAELLPDCDALNLASEPFSAPIPINPTSQTTRPSLKQMLAARASGGSGCGCGHKGVQNFQGHAPKKT